MSICSVTCQIMPVLRIKPRLVRPVVGCGFTVIGPEKGPKRRQPRLDTMTRGNNGGRLGFIYPGRAHFAQFVRQPDPRTVCLTQFEALRAR